MAKPPTDDRVTLTPQVTHSAYRHRQYSPVSWIFAAFGAFSLFFAIYMHFSRDLSLSVPVLIVGILAALTFAVICVSMRYLLVEDEGDALVVAFGRWRFPRLRIPYADVAWVEVSQTTIWDGWGIHYGPRGRVWNIWGWDCVVIHRKGGRTICIGTDEPEALAAIVRSRILQAE